MTIIDQDSYFNYVHKQAIGNHYHNIMHNAVGNLHMLQGGIMTESEPPSK